MSTTELLPAGAAPESNRADRAREIETRTGLIAALAAAYGKEADQPLLMAYNMALSDLPLTAINSAVHKAIRECKFMPTAPELRELAGVMRVDARAVLAWDAVKRAVSRQGGYRSITFDDPLINATVRNLGGWERFCETERGEQFDVWLRKEFERVYASLHRTGISHEMARPLCGIIDRTNATLPGDDKGHFQEAVTGLPAIKGLLPDPEMPQGKVADEVQKIIKAKPMKGIE